MFSEFLRYALVFVVLLCGQTTKIFLVVATQPAVVPSSPSHDASGAPAVPSSVSPVITRNTVCVLPLGDSLTQGVGTHGSYRAVLEHALQQQQQQSSVPHRTARNTIRVQYVGSHQRACTPKKPNLPFLSDTFLEPHEGHCSWNSRMLLQHVQQLWGGRDANINTNNDPLLSSPSSPSAAALPSDSHAAVSSSQRYVQRHCAKGVLDAVLLLIGHNDAFQAARHCRLREGDTGLKAAETTDELRVAAGSTHCVSEFLKEYEANLAAMVRLLLTTFPTAVVFLGLNPSTRFAVADVVLHQIITGVQQQWNLHSERESKGGGGAVVTVPFEGWSSRHTFDSTHPNALGNQLIAESWGRAMRQHLPQLWAHEGAGDPADPAALAEAQKEVEAVRRLEAAPAARVKALLGRQGVNWLPKHDGDDDASDVDDGAQTLRWLSFIAFGIPLAALIAVRRLRSSVLRLGALVLKSLSVSRSNR